MGLMLLTNEQKRIVVTVEQSGIYMIVSQAFEVGEANNRIVTYKEVYDLITGGYGVQVFGMSKALTDVISEYRTKQWDVPESELFEVRSACAAFMLVSNLNNCVLKCGTMEAVHEAAAKFNADCASVVLAINWVEQGSIAR